MDIVCCLDKSYLMPAGVMICSLCENNKNEAVTFHVMHNDLTVNEEIRLKKITDKYGKTILFYNVNHSYLKNISIGNRGQQKLSISTYYRLFIGDILPRHIKKIIYLDGDVIVCDNLREFWNIDVENVALAGVPDDNLYYGNIKQTYNRLKYPPNLGYFNAGVLLINLQYWREHNVIDIFLSLINSKVIFMHHDQDILNSVFHEKKLFIPLKYNLMSSFLWQPHYRNISWEYNEEIEQVARNPIIIHYTGVKPWYKECDHPYKKEFLKYKALTEWKDSFLKNNYKLRVKKIVKKILFYFNLLDNNRMPDWKYTYDDLNKGNK